MFLNIRSVPSQSARFANPVWQAMEGEHEMEELVGMELRKSNISLVKLFFFCFCEIPVLQETSDLL